MKGRGYGTFEEETSYPYKDFLRDIWFFLKPYRLRFFFATLARIGGDLVWLYPPFAIASIVTFFTTFEPGDSLVPLYTILLFFFLALIVRFFSQLFAKVVGIGIGGKMTTDSYEQAMQHMLALDIAWHERENTGNKLKKIQRGSEAFIQIARNWFVSFLEIAVNFIGALFIIAFFDTAVALMMGLFLVSYFVLGNFLMKKAVTAVREVNTQEGEINGLSFETLNGVRSVKALGMTGALSKILEAQLLELFARIKRRVFAFQFRGSFLHFWEISFFLLMIIYIAFEIKEGRHDVGFFVLFNGYFYLAMGSIRELANILQDFIVAKLSIARLSEILQKSPEEKIGEEKLPFPPDWEGVSFKNISFAYGAAPILQNVSLHIKKGEKVGIVGRSGAGKSTLFKLLLKEYDNFDGDILIGNSSLKDIQKEKYLARVAPVLQDTEVFNFSLRENIILSSSLPDPDEKRLNNAIEVSHISDFLDRLPKGIDTRIGEKGMRLSGGERQRLGLARAIYKSPEILLLDEATSHLDIESEGKIRDSLHIFFQDVTAIVIAHRLTTIREMDRIIVIENGIIVEEGAPGELIAKEGRFAELWKKQKF